MTAFRSWVKEKLLDDRDLLASYLYHCSMQGPIDSFVWSLLEETGDKKYNQDTFFKAADLVIGSKNE